jgi:hypothetical protein
MLLRACYEQASRYLWCLIPVFCTWNYRTVAVSWTTVVPGSDCGITCVR